MNDFEAAKNAIVKGLNIHRDSFGEMGSSYFYFYASLVYYDLGDLKQAEDHSEKAIELSIKNSEKFFEGLSRMSLGRTLVKIEPSTLDIAEEYILKGINMLEDLKLIPGTAFGYFFLGELYANTQQKEEALKNLNKAMAMCQEMEIGFWPDKIQEVLDRL